MKRASRSDILAVPDLCFVICEINQTQLHFEDSKLDEMEASGA